MSNAPDKKGTNQASDSAKPLDDDSLDGVVGGVGILFDPEYGGGSPLHRVAKFGSPDLARGPVAAVGKAAWDPGLVLPQTGSAPDMPFAPDAPPGLVNKPSDK